MKLSESSVLHSRWRSRPRLAPPFYEHQSQINDARTILMHHPQGALVYSQPVGRLPSMARYDTDLFRGTPSFFRSFFGPLFCEINLLRRTSKFMNRLLWSSDIHLWRSSESQLLCTVHPYLTSSRVRVLRRSLASHSKTSLEDVRPRISD